MLGEIGDAAEHVFEKAAFLAGADHAHGQLIEGPRVLGQRLGQAGAVGDAGPDFAQDFRQSRLQPLALENVEAAQERHAGAQQVGKLRIKRRHVPRLDLAAPAMARGRLDRRDGHRKQAAGIEHRHDLALAVRGQRALVPLAAVG